MNIQKVNIKMESIGKNVGAKITQNRIKTNSGIKHLLFDLQEVT